ncbi:MAG: hypothetical protein Q9174_000645 [Haloplaca sp. 1 TL-2023]
MTLDDSSGLTIEVSCRREGKKRLSTLDTTVDHHGNITLNGRLEPQDDHLLCTTNEGFQVDLKDIHIGSVVKIKGGVGEFRDEKQITLERITTVCTTNEEAGAWAQNATFYTNILSSPWIVTMSQQRQAKIDAEGSERDREARRERKREKRRTLEQMRELKAKKERGRGDRERDRGTTTESHRKIDYGTEKVPRKQEAVDERSQRGQRRYTHVAKVAVSGKFDALGL